MRCEFHPEAQVDLIETILYYESQAPGLGERFATEVRHAIDQLLQHRKIGSPDKEGFRKWVLGTFPYSLRYAEDDDVVYILVIESQHRKPGYWKSRIAR
jgi:plasmid stabilization system protein ParE